MSTRQNTIKPWERSYSQHPKKLQEVEPEITEPAEDISTGHISLVSDIPGYPPGGKLTVTMPNGEKIRHRYAPDTFVEVLEKIGLKRIAELDIMCRNAPLVEMFPSPNVRQRRSGNILHNGRYSLTLYDKNAFADSCHA